MKITKRQLKELIKEFKNINWSGGGDFNNVEPPDNEFAFGGGDYSEAPQRVVNKLRKQKEFPVPPPTVVSTNTVLPDPGDGLGDIQMFEDWEIDDVNALFNSGCTISLGNFFENHPHRKEKIASYEDLEILIKEAPYVGVQAYNDQSILEIKYSIRFPESLRLPDGTISLSQELDVLCYNTNHISFFYTKIIEFCRVVTSKSFNQLVEDMKEAENSGSSIFEKYVNLKGDAK